MSPRALILIAALLSLPAPASAAGLSKKEFAALEQTARKASQQADHDGLQEAIAALGTDDSWRAVKVIASLGGPSPSGQVYTAAVKALASMRSREVLQKTNKAVAKSKGADPLRLLLIDSLAEREDAESAEALLAVLGDDDPIALRAALAAIRARQPEGCVGRLFDFLERMNSAKVADGLLQSQTHRLLVLLTGLEQEDLGDWRAAWEIQKANRRAGPVKLEGAKTRTHRADQTRSGQFFGSEIRSTRVVFVVDASNSMQGSERLVNAKKQLLSAVEGLSERCQFTILAFANRVTAWKPTLQPATAANKESASAFVRALSTELATHTLRALERAFQVEDADSIVFLSDGAPTDKDPATLKRVPLAEILGVVRVLNRRQRRQLDTFLFPNKRKKRKKKNGKQGRDPEALEGFMRDLAHQNGGTFTRIAD